MKLKSALKSVPVLGPLVSGFFRLWNRRKFADSADYWDQRYISGGTSGAGSYNRLATFKADFLNDFVKQNRVSSVIEFGSGDGAQLDLADYPSYAGIDVSRVAVERAAIRFANDPSKTFYHSSEVPDGLRADLTLSLDVVYHLIEDERYEGYMRDLFAASCRFVIIYSSNYDEQRVVPHVRHRQFTRWVGQARPDFELIERVPNAYPFDENDPNNTSFAEFYVFERA